MPTTTVHRHSENLTVVGADPAADVRATLRIDDGTTYRGERDTNHPEIVRIRFFIESPPTNLGWGATLDLEADGYEPITGQRLVIGVGDHELPSLTMTKGPGVVVRRGAVALAQRTFTDDGGPFLAVGASLFWAGWGYLHDRARLEQNLEFLSKRNVDYIRVLGVVGPRFWTDRTVSAGDVHNTDLVDGLTDLVFDRYGMRIEWSIFGGVDTTPTAADRNALVSQFIERLRTREHKVHHFEVWNEAWGTRGDSTEVKRFADRLRAETPNIVATTACSPLDEEGKATWYGGSRANLMTVHLDRSTGGEGGMWRPVRQARDPNLVWAGAWTSNEPIGPQSSVAADDDPLRLAMSACLTWLCNGAGYVLHTGAGIRGGGVEDVQRGRSANLGDVPKIDATFAKINALRALLPRDLPNWSFQNNNRQAGPRHPFQVDDLAGAVERGNLLRAFAAVASDRFVCIPLVSKTPLNFTATFPMRFVVYDGDTAAEVETKELNTGETYVLPPGLARVIVGGGR